MLHRVSSSARLWRLAKWARHQSHRPPPPPGTPALRPSEDVPATDYRAEKAAILAAKFFRSVTPGALPLEPALEPQPPPEPALKLWPRSVPITLSQTITPADVEQALANTAPWKAPGMDELLTGFLKAYGSLLYRVLAHLYSACLAIGHWPNDFKCALVVVIPKAGKTAGQRELASGW